MSKLKHACHYARAKIRSASHKAVDEGGLWGLMFIAIFPAKLIDKLFKLIIYCVIAVITMFIFGFFVPIRFFYYLCNGSFKKDFYITKDIDCYGTSIEEQSRRLKLGWWLYYAMCFILGWIAFIAVVGIFIFR